MSASTSNCRRFNFGKRSVPPATNIARGPRSAAIRAASRAVFGRRYLNRGSRSTVQLFWRWLDFDGWGIRDLGEARRAISRLLALVLAAQRLHDLLGRHGNFIDPYPERVENRGAHRGDDRQQRALARFLRAVRSFRVVGFDD